MNADEYIREWRGKNKKMFDAYELRIKPAELEKIARAAFKAGEEHGRNAKSIFEQMFGKNV